MAEIDEVTTAWDDFLVAVLERVAEGRLDAKTFASMTPEQRAEYRERLVQEEKDAISEGLGRHTKPDDE